MANLAIIGHATRGNEVIEILEMLGGKNSTKYFGDDDDAIYSIEGQEIVIYELEWVKIDAFIVFTLEEFLEKFPYKVGDKVKVLANMYCGVFDIQGMEWYCVSKVVKYNVHGYWLSAENLQAYKEEDMEEKNNDNCIKWDLPVGYELQDKEGNVINTDTIKLVKKQPQYPKTYEECCKVLGHNSVFNDNRGYKWELLCNLQKLLICRDAYWKIAGEQVGLGKSWEPDFDNENEYKYGLFRLRNIIYKDATCINPTLLIFPTAEMRDAFKENFNDDIELCKEFL